MDRTSLTKSAVRRIPAGVSGNEVKCFACSKVFSFHNPTEFIWDANDAFDALSIHVQTDHAAEWAERSDAEGVNRG